MRFEKRKKMIKERKKLEREAKARNKKKLKIKPGERMQKIGRYWWRKISLLPLIMAQSVYMTHPLGSIFWRPYRPIYMICVDVLLSGIIVAARALISSNSVQNWTLIGSKFDLLFT